MIATNTIYDALYAIPGANAGVLALVPGGATSMFHRRGLTNLNGKTLPYLVWHTDVRDGDRGEMAALYCDWFIYISIADAERDLHTLADAVEAAYANPFAVPWGRVTIGRRGKPFAEEIKHLQGLRLPLAYRALG